MILILKHLRSEIRERFPGESEDAVQQMSEDSGEDSESSSKLETQKYAEDQNADKPSDEIVNNNENGQRTVTVLKQDDYIAPFDRVVFIDSTWNQTKSIYNDERLKGNTLTSYNRTLVIQSSRTRRVCGNYWDFELCRKKICVFYVIGDSSVLWKNEYFELLRFHCIRASFNG